MKQLGSSSIHVDARGSSEGAEKARAAKNEARARQLNLGIALRIDESYVAEENQRLRLYKKIAGAASEAAIDEVRAEMEDRYGALPDVTVFLLEAALLRLECERIGISQVDRKRSELADPASQRMPPVDPTQLMQLVARNARRGAQFTPQGVLNSRYGLEPENSLATKWYVFRVRRQR